MRLARFKLPGKAWWIAFRERGWRFAVAEAQVSFFPVVLAAVLAAMAYWLAVVSSPQDEDFTGRFRHDPDAIVGKFVMRSFGEQGLKKDVLNAEGAEHYPDDESTMMIKPNLVHQNAGDTPPLR